LKWVGHKPAHFSFVGRKRGPDPTLLRPLPLDVVAGPELGQELGDHEVAALRALDRRADVPVRRDVVGRGAPVRHRGPAPSARLRLQALEVVVQDGVKLGRRNGGSHGLVIPPREASGGIATSSASPPAPRNRLDGLRTAAPGEPFSGAPARFGSK
jgi:hypothetical protein